PGVLSEHDVAAPRIAACVRVALVRPDEQVRQPVAVYVPGAGNAKAAQVILALAVDNEAAGAVRNCGEIDVAPRALAEHHVAAPELAVAAAGGFAVGRPHDQVGQAVAIDVAGAGNTAAAEVIYALPVDDEAAGAGIDRGE